jgi:ABC-type cobalt transport system substrate-binding protein
VKRIAYLVVACLLAMLILVPIARAQEDTVAGDDDLYLPEPKAIEVDLQPLQQIAGQPLPETGGLAINAVLLPAGALLLGSGVLAYALLRGRANRRATFRT